MGPRAQESSCEVCVLGALSWSRMCILAPRGGADNIVRPGGQPWAGGVIDKMSFTGFRGMLSHAELGVVSRCGFCPMGLQICPFHKHALPSRPALKSNDCFGPALDSNNRFWGGKRCWATLGFSPLGRQHVWEGGGNCEGLSSVRPECYFWGGAPFPPSARDT